MAAFSKRKQLLQTRRWKKLLKMEKFRIDLSSYFKPLSQTRRLTCKTSSKLAPIRNWLKKVAYRGLSRALAVYMTQPGRQMSQPCASMLHNTLLLTRQLIKRLSLWIRLMMTNSETLKTIIQVLKKFLWQLIGLQIWQLMQLHRSRGSDHRPLPRRQR